MLILCTNSAVNVAKDGVISGFLQSPTEDSRVLHIGKTDNTISLEAEMEEIEILRNNRCCGTGEVQGERIFHRAEVVKLEDEVLGEVGLVSPYDPANSDVAQTEFVAAGRHVNEDRSNFCLKNHSRGID